MDFAATKRKHHLAGAAERAKSLEDQPDRLLQAPVRPARVPVRLHWPVLHPSREGSMRYVQLAGKAQN